MAEKPTEQIEIYHQITTLGEFPTILAVEIFYMCVFQKYMHRKGRQ